ncbi:MAG: ABC transporter [Candidatus Peregrinibacteria bacterium GW2011_GWF2_33_10]|nr:MAG: ABC transporter [Candidatus Peregrinibacteria bacterium GW2011_GWF2_33_10]OGJ44975.1 MAG: hypothetical protein A2263_02835 [Candidatus Peregrinibacteria bacterium RIFOXYA2_FULL_33_21]OGJ46363.1 MAG: hypothetical protein A2272_01100 [Candidatus Peregrinibacteria bacterium RIFOXYA12_FULL_33_12]OGJ50718.1 MAG: hypothetical protein A2307_03650 [Candidatus Peregrinibacteria bacterium RIFOXYB2_FULL_33_20]
MDFSHHFQHNKHLVIRGWILLGILILINLISISHFARIDLTKENKYKISSASENIINKLDDIVNIKIYVSDKLPPNLNSSLQYVKDLLSEYQAFSKGNIKVSYLDPSADTNTMQEAGSVGIPQIQMEILEKDKYQVQNGYFGLAVFYAGQTESIPFIQDLGNFEYDLTSKLKKVIDNDNKSIGFLTGHQEHGSNNDLQALAQSLEKNYQIKTINLANNDPIDTDTLIISGPKDKMSTDDFNKISDYLKKGGKMILLVDSLDIGQGLQTTVLDMNSINDFLKNYGLSVNNDILYDKYHENASFSQGTMNFLLPYPFFVKLINDNFDKQNPIVSGLSSVIIPWTSSLTIENKEDIKITKLLRTSDYADHQVGNFNLDPQQKFILNDPKQFDIGVMVNDQLIIIADSDFVTDSFVSRYPQNLNFMLNAVDFITLDPDLIAIRSKTFSDNPLTPISENYYLPIKILGTFLSSLLLIAFGLVRAKKRRKLQQNY